MAWNTPVAIRLVELADIRHGMTVLDVGCGTGAAAFAAARAAGHSGLVIGLDSAAAMVVRARHDAQATGIRNAIFACENAETIPYATGTFNVVVSSMVVSYLPQPAKALHHWCCLLTPGGAVAFSWVQAEDPAWLPVLGAVDEFLPPEQQRWSPRERWAVPEAEAMLPPGMIVSTTTEPVTTRYRDADHFWAASWTQATAITWARIPPRSRADAQKAASAMLAGLAHRDGPLERTRTVCYTIARLLH